MCVCVCMCMCVCMCVCVCMYVYECMWVCICMYCVYVRVRMYGCVLLKDFVGTVSSHVSCPPTDVANSDELYEHGAITLIVHSLSSIKTYVVAEAAIAAINLCTHCTCSSVAVCRVVVCHALACVCVCV